MQPRLSAVSDMLLCACSFLEGAIGDAQAVICATGATGFGSSSAASVDEKVRCFLGSQLDLLVSILGVWPAALHIRRGRTSHASGVGLTLCIRWCKCACWWRRVERLCK